MTEELHTICPFCDQHHEAITLAYGELECPDDGDVTLCFLCGRVCVFDSGAEGGLRKPTKREQRTFDRDEKLNEMVTTWKRTMRQ